MVGTLKTRCVYAEVVWMMNILVTGSSGMLGLDVVMELCRHYHVFGLDHRNDSTQPIPIYRLNITERERVEEAITKVHPHVIVHTAAYTDVDGCEQNQELAFAVNSEATRYLAEASQAAGAQLIFLSSDYVFDGSKKEPYQEDDCAKPRSVYGESKWKAEQFLISHDINALIIRTSWLFGAKGKNFFRSILNQAAQSETLKVVDDQKGAPTYTKDLAHAIKILIDRWQSGIRLNGCHVYHIANSGSTTWYDAAKIILGKAGCRAKLSRISSKDLDRPAERPKNSVFDLSKVRREFGIELRTWEDALDDYWHESLEKEWNLLTHTRAN